MGVSASLSRAKGRFPMKRKFGPIGNSGSLLSVLVAGIAIASLAVMPAAAQAEPHLYKNGALTPEGVKVPVLGFGTLQLENINLGLIECHNIVSGNEENPTGGGGAKGELEGNSAYNCNSAACESAGKTVEAFPIGLNNPKEGNWEIHMVEEPAGTFKLKLGNKEAKNSRQLKLEFKCAGIFETEFHGELKPNAKNGTSIGASPSKVEFKGPESGELESSIGGGWYRGKLKLMGYEGQDLITVKNP